jgi:hypothetical protein
MNGLRSAIYVLAELVRLYLHALKAPDYEEVSSFSVIPSGCFLSVSADSTPIDSSTFSKKMAVPSVWIMLALSLRLLSQVFS